MLPLISILVCLAADISVRRESSGFIVVGPVKAGDIAVYVGVGDVPPVLGIFITQPAAVLFQPRYEIPATVATRVVVKGQTFHFPATASPSAPSTFVEQIYPTANQLPANQLKFYIQFSAPMHPGEAWQNIELLDANNKPVDLPFIELDQELWDPSNRRLTILFDPGRIKRGVTPRDEIGTSIEAGKTYTLRINSAWRDQDRIPIVSAYSKTFTVVAEDRTAIDPTTWRVTKPNSRTRAPLRIDFNESLDAALALRLIKFPMPGTSTLGANESALLFTPTQPWPPGPFDIEIDTALEDLAGNKVGRPFDVDTFDPITVRTTRGVVKLPVQIR